MCVLMREREAAAQDGMGPVCGDDQREPGEGPLGERAMPGCSRSTNPLATVLDCSYNDATPKEVQNE